MKRRIAAVVSVIAAVIVLAGAAWVIHKKNPVPDAGQTPGSTTVPTVSASLSPSASTSASSSSPAPITAAFIGDDYTLGNGASSASKAFVPLVAGQADLNAKAYGVSGGGYAKPDVNGHTFADLITQAVSTRPALIIVTGGRNDEYDNPDSLAAAVTAFFTQLHTAAPYATIVAVTPFFGDSPSPAAVTKLAAQVHNAVKGVGGQYIDLTDPLLGHSSYMASSTEPNDSGYAAIASALSARLKPIVTALQRGATPHSSGSASGSGSSTGHSSGGSPTG